MQMRTAITAGDLFGSMAESETFRFYECRTVLNRETENQRFSNLSQCTKA